MTRSYQQVVGVLDLLALVNLRYLLHQEGLRFLESFLSVIELFQLHLELLYFEVQQLPFFGPLGMLAGVFLLQVKVSLFEEVRRH